MQLSLIRDVLKSECPWLDRDMKKGEVVFNYRGPTYGCIGGGIACTEKPGETPFFELPANALR